MATTSLLGFVMDIQFVYCAVRTEFVCIIKMDFVMKAVYATWCLVAALVQTFGHLMHTFSYELVAKYLCLLLLLLYVSAMNFCRLQGATSFFDLLSVCGIFLYVNDSLYTLLRICLLIDSNDCNTVI